MVPVTSSRSASVETSRSAPRPCSARRSRPATVSAVPASIVSRAARRRAAWVPAGPHASRRTAPAAAAPPAARRPAGSTTTRSPLAASVPTRTPSADPGRRSERGNEIHVGADAHDASTAKSVSAVVAITRIPSRAAPRSRLGGPVATSRRRRGPRSSVTAPISPGSSPISSARPWSLLQRRQICSARPSTESTLRIIVATIRAFTRSSSPADRAVGGEPVDLLVARRPAPGRPWNSSVPIACSISTSDRRRRTGRP